LERPKPARIIEAKEIARNVACLRIENPLEELPRPGQFIMVWNGSDEKPMAVTRISEEELFITVKKVGPFTEALTRSKPGEMLGLRGPYGRAFDLCFRKPILIGGGIGASPLLYLASNLAPKKRNPRIMLGFNSASDAIYLDEFKRLGMTQACTVDGSMGLRGNVTDNLPPLSEFDCIFTCGPEAMMAAAGRKAETAKAECQLLVERYFKCGIGLCGSCALGTFTVCKDGPVFFWRELKQTEFGLFKRDGCGRRESIP
jgi:dihydroorotate dehydrogenase electron transfer subunit